MIKESNMIDIAHFPKDREDIVRLWGACFGDARHYIEFFLDNLPSENVLFVYKIEGNIAGMFFLMSANFRYKTEESIQKQKIQPVFYVYAVGVAPEYRKNGIAGKMLEFAKEYAAREGAELCLVPANDALGSYYANRGFKKVPATNSPKYINEALMDKIVRKTSDMIKIDTVQNIYLLDKYIDALYNKRVEALGNVDALVWDINNFRFALIEHLYTGGSIYIDDNVGDTGDIEYVIARVGQNGIFVREAVVSESDGIISASGNCAMITYMSYGNEVINDAYDKYINFCFD